MWKGRKENKEVQKENIFQWKENEKRKKIVKKRKLTKEE